MDFLKYWDTRIDVYENLFNANPNLANFAFSECQSLYDHMEDENKALHAELAALKEAVVWERECGEMRFTDIWFDEWNRTVSQSKNAMRELRATVDAARADVVRLLEDRTTDAPPKQLASSPLNPHEI